MQSMGTVMIHKLDPNHLVTTMLAGINQKEFDYIQEKCPAIDLIAVPGIRRTRVRTATIKSVSWTKPYIVTEWGPTGHWEVTQTPWSASMKRTAVKKRRSTKPVMGASIGTDKNCLGSYVFLWGQKQGAPHLVPAVHRAGEETKWSM